MTDVDYGGGGHRTRLRDLRDQLLCLWGAPGHVYKGVEEGERAGPYGAPWRSPTPTGNRIPPFQVVGVGEKEGEERGKGRGPGPHPIRIGLGGAPPTFSLHLLYSTKAQ